MTKKELDKKFPFSGKDGKCSDCEYTEHCDKILPGFNKPGKCAGPFEKADKKEKGGKTKNEQVIRLNESQLRQIIAESIEDVLGGGIDIGQELQHFLQDNRYKLFNKGWGDSQPTKRDYLIAKHFYELGKGEQENDE